MSDQLLKTTIKIEGVETKVSQSGKTFFRVKGSDKRNYQVWQFTQSGRDSVAFVSFSNFPNMGVGRKFDISYKEEQGNFNGKPVTYRTIVQAFLNRDKENSGMREFEPERVKTVLTAEEKKWNQIAFGKCKHAFLIEAYKQNRDIDLAEKEAEVWATASMRVRLRLQGKSQIGNQETFDPYNEESIEEETIIDYDLEGDE
jgi:hypothetical protein